jgi:hypothetical protein
VIKTGVTGVTGGADAIHVVSSGSYLIAHNSIDCGWANGAAIGIHVVGQGFAPEASAIVVDNDVTIADIYVDAGVTNTAVIGRQGRVEDHGTGTVIVPMR